MVKRNVTLEFEFKGAHLTSMVFKFLACETRRQIGSRAHNVEVFQSLRATMSQDLYLDVQINARNVLGNAPGLSSSVSDW
jgi:hypothetical protein